MEDEALLSRELYWRARPGDRRRPAGSNAITAIGIVLTLLLWGITAIVGAPFVQGSSGSGVIDPRAFVVLAVCGIEMFVAAMMAGRIWVAIGPRGRGVLRPIAVLGPWPMIGIVGFAVLYVVAIFAAPFLRTEPATSGRNWRVAATAAGGVTYEEAAPLCEATGERVPTRDDLGAFDPPFPQGTSVWLAPAAPTEDGVLFLSAEGRFTLADSRRREVRRHHVVCFRP